jgi:hypothetical protein
VLQVVADRELMFAHFRQHGSNRVPKSVPAYTVLPIRLNDVALGTASQDQLNRHRAGRSRQPIPRDGPGPAQSPDLHQLPLHLEGTARPVLRKSSVEQVAHGDILAFMARCYQLGLGHRAVYNKLLVVLQLFKRHGKSDLIASSDWPKCVEKIRPIYEPEEIQSMLNHA